MQCVACLVAQLAETQLPQQRRMTGQHTQIAIKPRDLRLRHLLTAINRSGVVISSTNVSAMINHLPERSKSTLSPLTEVSLVDYNFVSESEAGSVGDATLPMDKL